MKRRIRDNEATPKFTWKTYKDIKKNHGLIIDKKVHYEEQKQNTRFYLTQAYQSFPNHLTSTFHFQLLTFFRSTLEVHTKLDLSLFLNPHKKKMRFYTNPNRFKIEMNEWRINPFLSQENPLKICLKTWTKFS